MLKICFLLGLGLFGSFTRAARANDGFYNGSGTELIPVHNDGMRVIREDLEITPLAKPRCYGIEFPKSEYKKGILKDGAKGAKLSKEKPCGPTMRDFDPQLLVTRWHARAEYQIEASKEQKQVQMGFPVPQWSYDWSGEDGLYETAVPGATGFRTYIDGKEVMHPALKSVEVPQIFKSNQPKQAPAYVWKADFKAGSRHTLVSEYDFGTDYSTGFQGPIWFPPEDLTLAYQIIYYLHPIQLWGTKAPEKIRIQVKAPENVPAVYFTDVSPGRYCVDTDRISLGWENQFPKQDLRLSYPHFQSGKYPGMYPMIQTPEQFALWRKGLETSATQPFQVSCRLAEQLRKVPGLEKDESARKLLAGCTERCD